MREGEEMTVIKGPDKKTEMKVDREITGEEVVTGEKIEMTEGEIEKETTGAIEKTGGREEAEIREVTETTTTNTAET